MGKVYTRLDQNGAKTLPDGAAHTYMAYIREYPPRDLWLHNGMSKLRSGSLRASSPISAIEASLARTRERAAKPSFARSREARPNRRACSQAKDPAITFQNKPLISLVKLVVSIISVILEKREIAFDSLLSEGRLAFANNNIFSKGGRYCRNFSTSRHFAAFVSEL